MVVVTNKTEARGQRSTFIIGFADVENKRDEAITTDCYFNKWTFKNFTHGCHAVSV